MEENKTEFIVRKATKDDMETVRSMIQELADFEKISDGPKLTTTDLIKDAGLTGQQEFFHCYIVEVTISSSLPTRLLTRSLIAYSVCFFAYSTWEGRSYFMEDIYVKPEYRNRGVGRLLFQHIIKMARQYNCSRLDFHVLNWNPAQYFYQKMGVKNLTNVEGWHFYRLDKSQMENLLTNKKILQTELHK